MLSEYEGHICITCDECGVDCNTGVAPDGDLGAWMDRYGWSNEMRDDGDYDYFCPTCTRERVDRDHIYPDVVSHPFG